MGRALWWSTWEITWVHGLMWEQCSSSLLWVWGWEKPRAALQPRGLSAGCFRKVWKGVFDFLREELFIELAFVSCTLLPWIAGAEIPPASFCTSLQNSKAGFVPSAVSGLYSFCHFLHTHFHKGNSSQDAFYLPLFTYLPQHSPGDSKFHPLSCTEAAAVHWLCAAFGNQEDKGIPSPHW